MACIQWGLNMKLTSFLAALAVLSACGSPYAGRSDEWIARKETCAAGNIDVCAEIAHEERAAQGGTAADQRVFKISEPIVD